MIEVPQFRVQPSEWVEDKKLWGKHLAKAIRNELAEKIAGQTKQPGLAALIVGEDPASQIYVRNKEKAAEKAGFYSIVERMPADSSQQQVLAKVQQFNKNDKIHGILVQLPLPGQIDANAIVQSILPEKDGDGFHISNVGRLFSKQPGVVACTPLGIMVMLNQMKVDLAGKHAVVLGRSNIVGKPMAQLLLDAANCTVTVCHSRTENIAKEVSRADIVVSAMGVRNVFDNKAIADGAIVIDVGMHRENDKLMGDLDPDDFVDRVSYYTPVPGGVGPLTIAMLLYNTYNNFLKIEGLV